MNLLHRYLFRELLIATVVAVGLFGTVMLAGSALKDIVGRLANGVFSLSTGIELIVLLVPFVVTYALPMGLLTAILLTLGRASANNEITAMRAAGIGFSRIAAPIVLIALAGVVISLVINLSFAPLAKTQYRKLLAEAGQRNPLNLVQPRQFVRDFPGVVIYVDAVSGDTLRDVWLWKLDKDKQVERFVRGETARLRWDEAANVLSLEIANVQLHEDPFNAGKPPRTGWVATFPYTVDLSRVFQKREFTRKPSWLSFTELIAERQRLRGSVDPADAKRRVEVEMNLHEKTALAFAALSFAIVGIPLGIRTRRSETSANLGVALLLALAYYLLLSVATWVKDKPHLHPELLFWIPNVGFQALGGWLWWRLGRN